MSPQSAAEEPARVAPFTLSTHVYGILVAYLEPFDTMYSQITKAAIKKAGGFSPLESIIAVIITLAFTVTASTLLATWLKTRERENSRADVLVAAQHALNIMSREIANSGYGLTDNGIVITDSGPGSIRVRANTNNNSTLADPDEDVRYIYETINRSVVRFDNFPSPAGNRAILAKEIDNFTLTYWDVHGARITDPARYGMTQRITIEVRVSLPADAEEPATVVKLAADVTLRNAQRALF